MRAKLLTRRLNKVRASPTHSRSTHCKMVFGSLVVNRGRVSLQFQLVRAASDVLMSRSNLLNPVVRSDHQTLFAPPRSIFRQSLLQSPSHSSVLFPQQLFFRGSVGARLTQAGGYARSPHSLRVLERDYCGLAAEADIKMDESHEDDHDDDEDGDLDNERIPHVKMDRGWVDRPLEKWVRDYMRRMKRAQGKTYEDDDDEDGDLYNEEISDLELDMEWMERSLERSNKKISDRLARVERCMALGIPYEGHPDGDEVLPFDVDLRKAGLGMPYGNHYQAAKDGGLDEYESFPKFEGLKWFDRHHRGGDDRGEKSDEDSDDEDGIPSFAK